MSFIPYVIEQNSRGERSYDIYSRLLSDRIIFLGEEVICLYINSPGGSISAGFAIYDTMSYIKCDVSTICIGMAASFGAFLLAGGTKGKRMALPNAEIMIHQPAIHGNGIQGQATDICLASEHIQKSKERLNRILAENTGKTPKEIEAATERDHYLSAQEALDFGLIDRIISKNG